MPDTDRGQGPAARERGPRRRRAAEGEAPRAEAAELRRRQRQARRRGFSWRTPVAALLIVAGCVLAPVPVLAVWTANQVSDTGRYVANMAPLIKDPAIQDALTGKVTSEIVTKIDVKGLTGQVAAELSHKGCAGHFPGVAPKMSLLLGPFIVSFRGWGEVREFAGQSEHQPPRAASPRWDEVPVVPPAH